MILTQVLISRNYRGDLEMSVVEKFFPLVLDREDEGNSSPIIIHESATFTYIKHHNLYGKFNSLQFIRCVHQRNSTTLPTVPVQLVL